ncbi:MAG: hypothetical protein AAFN10_04920 [Bacteroidota bacterium]
MSWQRLIWLQGPQRATIEIPLTRSLFLQETADAQAQQSLSLLQLMLAGEPIDEFLLGSEQAYGILEIKVKRSRRCLVYGRSQGVSRAFWVRNAYEEELFLQPEGDAYPFGELLSRIAEKAIAIHELALNASPFADLPTHFGIEGFDERWADLWEASRWRTLSPIKKLLLPKAQASPLKNLVDTLQSYVQDQQELQAFERLLEERQQIIQLGEEWQARKQAITERQAQLAEREQRQNLQLKKLEAEREKLQSQIAMLQQKAPESIRKQKERSILEAKIDYARQRQEFYSQLNVEAHLELVSQIPLLEAQVNKQEVLALDINAWWTLLGESIQSGQQMQEAFAALLVDQQAAFTHQSEYLHDLLQNLGESLKLAPEIKAGEISPERWIAAEKKLIQQQIDQTQGQKRLQSLQQERTQSLEAAKAALKEARQQYESSLASLEKAQKRLSEQARDHKQSLLAWLENNYPEWEQRFGKVLREEVLRQAYLGPSIARINEQIFGVNLDLDEIELPELPKIDFAKEEAAIAEQIEQQKHDWVKEEQSLVRKQENLQKRWKQRLRDQQRKLDKLGYEIEQTDLRIRKMRTDYRSQLQNQQQQQEQARLRQQYALDALQKVVQEQVLQIQDYLTDLQAQWDQLSQKWEQNWLSQQAKVKDFLQNEVKGEVEADNPLVQLHQARMFQPLVMAYQQEKAMLLDRLPLWAEDLEQSRQAKTPFPDHLHIEVLTERLFEIEATQREDPLADLHEQIQESQTAAELCEQSLQRMRQAFLAYFDAKGPFQAFHAVEMADFATYLREFMQRNELTELREQLGVKHSDLLGKLLEQLPSFAWRESLAAQIDQWNDTLLKESRFVLTLVEAPHPLLSLFEELRQFHAQFVAELGAPSLFTTNEGGNRNLQALDLLDRIYKELLAYPFGELQVADVCSLQLVDQRHSSSLMQPDRLPTDLPASLLAQLRLALAHILITELAEAKPSFWLWPDANMLPPSILEQAFAECEKRDLILLSAGFQGTDVV